MSNHPAQLQKQQQKQQQQQKQVLQAQRKRKAHAASPNPGVGGKRMRSLAELLASADPSPASSGGQPIAPPPPQPQQGHALHSLHPRGDTDSIDSGNQLWHGIDALVVAAATAQQAAPEETPRPTGIPPASASSPAAPTLRTPGLQQQYNARQQQPQQPQQQWSQQQPAPPSATAAITSNTTTSSSSSGSQHLLEQASQALVLRRLVQHLRSLLLQPSGVGAAAAGLQPTATAVLVQALLAAVVRESGVEEALSLAHLLLHHLRAPQLQPVSSWGEQAQVPHATLQALLQRLP